MTICLDISQIAYEGTGVARFTRGLVETICARPKEDDWIFFFSGLRTSAPSEIIELIKKSGHTYVRAYYPPTVFAWLNNTVHKIPIETYIGHSVDWYISSDWTQAPCRARRATIVHDLVFVKYPETVADTIIQTQQKRLGHVDAECEVIFCDSESTKNDCEEFFSIKNARLVTNYPGVNPPSQLPPAILEQTKRQYKLDRPYILAVGKIEPRKNLHRLIAAYLRLYRDDVDLVIVGQQGWDVSAQELVSNAAHETTAGAAARELQIASNNIHFLGYVPDDALQALYSQCMIFSMPSLWEGFGYPVIEAMQQAAAVCCSNTSSLAEIADDAALTFNPLDVADITRALHHLLENENDRAMYQQRGPTRAAAFRWDTYYDTMMKELRPHTNA